MRVSLFGCILAGSALLALATAASAADSPKAPTTRPATADEVQTLHRDYTALAKRIYLLSEYREIGTGPSGDQDGPPQRTFHPDPNKLLPGKGLRGWRRYEDEYLSFLCPIPAGGDVRVKVSGSDDFMAGVLADSPRFWKRKYEIIGSPKKGVSAVSVDLNLSRSDWFLEGDCLCEVVRFVRLLSHNGSFYRFDQTGPGKIKWFRVLRGGMHMEMSGSVHLRIDQNLYTAIGLSVRIKRPACDEAKCRKTAGDRYGPAGLVSLIEPGMTIDQLASMLGKPVERCGDALIFRGVRKFRPPYGRAGGPGRYLVTVEVPIQNGRFVGFKGPPEIFGEDIPAERPSLAWVLDAAGEPRDELFGDPNERPKAELLRPKDVRLIFDRFAEIAPKACPEDWDLLCQAMIAMAESGHRDGRVLPIVKQRITHPDYARYNAAEVVLACEPDHRKAWAILVSAMRKVLADTPADWKPNDPHDDDPDPLVALEKIPESYEPMFDLIKAAMRHPNPYIRLKGHQRCRGVLGKEAVPLLGPGLEDAFYRIREAAAKALGDYLAEDPAVEGLLIARLKVEKVPRVREAIARALRTRLPWIDPTVKPARQ